MILHHSSPVSRLIPSPDHHLLSLHTHGTRVTVHDLFGNMPVRVKQRGALFGNNEYLEKEWDDLKKRIIGLLLAWGQPVVLKIADKERKRRWTSGKAHADANVTDIIQTGLKNRHSSFDLTYTRYLLFRIGDTTPENSSWKSVSARTALVAIRGVISLDPCPTKKAQFLSFGNQAVESRSCKNVLYDEINQIFVLSSFGISDTNSGCYNGGAQTSREEGPNITEPINKALQLGAKGVDKWPKFYIRFDVKSTTFQNNAVSEHGDNSESETSVEKVLEVLRSMLFQFLKQHDLQPRARKRRRIREQVVPEESTVSAKCRATERDTTAPKNTINELPVLLAPALQTRGFGGWSRIKGSKTEALEDLYSGLPRSKRKHFTNKSSGANEQGSKDTSTPSTQTQTPHRIVRPSISGSSVDAFSEPSQLGHLEDRIVCSAGDDVISWTHPTTGNAVLINARTGLVVLPSDPTQKDIESATLSSRASSAIPSRDYTTRKGSLQNLRLNTALPKADSWVGELLQGWDNPMFRKAEETIPCVSLQDIDPSTAHAKGRCNHECSENETQLFERTFRAGQVAYSGTLSKTGLKRAEVLGQVDQKFILVKVDVALGGDETEDVADALLVLVDQHAADERCRIESLLDALCRPEAGASWQSFQVQSAQLPAPIRFSVTAQEARLFHLHAKHFDSWGICYQLRNPSPRPSSDSSASSFASDNVLTVTRLPPTILERCRLEQSLLVDILRSEVWALDEKASTKATLPANTKHDIAGDSDSGPRWVERIGQCPHKVIEMLNSRACRSSIMFNDVLSHDECKSLISRLAECAFPFQCAHGRPSMIPIANLGAFGTASGLMEARGGHDSRPEERPYARAFDAWRATLAGEG